jgi:hypothetical protein|tara:strand:- start:1337 stop:2503 length:1167 start_codon:yes stop_codon:yes gene_type:complete
MEENQEIVEQPAAEVAVEDTSPMSVSDDGTIKLDMGKFAAAEAEAPAEQPVIEQPVMEQVNEDTPPEPVPEAIIEDAVLEEITEEEVVEQVEELTEQVEQAIVKADLGIELPENIQKVVDFMNETSGSLEDYVKLNQNYEELNPEQLLKEYYADTKPHLDQEDIEFLMEDNFLYDEDIDEERDIKRKKLARREELAKARNHLTGLKDKYYEEIRGGARLAPEQKKAVEFFNRYTKENEAATQLAEKQSQTFLNKTEGVFNNDFKGFDYQVGDKKFRFKVKDAPTIKETQSDINNFVKKFLDKDNQMSDAAGYHKGLFTAMNADSIANHFYEQGKADAMKTSMSNSKNVQMGARGVHEDVKTSNGWAVRSVDSGGSDSKLKIKTFKHIK